MTDESAQTTGFNSRVPVVKSRRQHTIAVASIIGFVFGLVGIFAGSLVSTPIGGAFLGAVACGVAVAHLSEEPIPELVGQEFIADVLSSIAFFVLVLVAYLTSVSLDEGISILGTILVSLYYLAFGGRNRVQRGPRLPRHHGRVRRTCRSRRPPHR